MAAVAFPENSALLKSVKEITSLQEANKMLHQVHIRERALLAEQQQLVGARGKLQSRLGGLDALAADVLEVVQAEAEQLMSEVSSTSKLAEGVSGKVRQLDLAQSNLQAALAQVQVSLQRSQCLQGIQAALERGDYEAACQHVCTFSELEQEGQGEGEVPEEHITQQRQVLEQAQAQLQGVVRSRFSEACQQQHADDVKRYAKLFKPLGLVNEGHQRYVDFLASQLQGRVSQALQEQQSQQSSGGVDHHGLLNAIFREIGVTIENELQDIRSMFDFDGALALLGALQKLADKEASIVVQNFMTARQVTAMVNRIHSDKSTGGQGRGQGMGQVAQILGEVVGMCQSGEEFINFVVQRIQQVGGPEQEKRMQLIPSQIRGGKLGVILSQLSNYYVALEEYYIEASVAKAIEINEPVSGGLTSSLVDDIFFLLQQSCLRAISSRKGSGVCQVVSGSNRVLATTYLDTLRSKMAGAPHTLLSSVPEDDGDRGVELPQSVREAAAALNNPDVSTEYIAKLLKVLEDACYQIYSKQENEKMHGVLQDLQKTSGDLRKLANEGLQQVCDLMIPRLRPLLDEAAGTPYDINESQYESLEVQAGWVHKLLAGVEELLMWIQEGLTPTNYEVLSGQVTDYLATRLEAVFLQKRFSQLGGLQLDKDLRQLCGYLGELMIRGVREKFARVMQTSTLLSLESVDEVLEYWGATAAGLTWRLTAAEVKEILLLRSDFDQETVQALEI